MYDFRVAEDANNTDEQTIGASLLEFGYRIMASDVGRESEAPGSGAKA
jgi:hypothetical protein